MFALLAFIFSILCLKRLRHVIKLDYKRPLFIMLATGTMLYVIAEILSTVFNFVLKITTTPSVADIFHIGGALALVSGFLYFWISTKAWSKFTLKDWGLLLLGIALSAGYMVYLFFGIVIPEGMYYSFMLNFLNFFYPITSALAFILSYVLHIHYREGLIRRAYLYLADGIFFIFMGDMFFSYVSWMGTYGISGVLSDTFHMIGYMLLAISLYIFYGTSKR
ncbi:MAG: hypothetical protein KJ574_05240 [Nanoarchaeota archaeon]|nr:hypothetical protein [Nanoarchaeota archaeon]